MIEVYDLSKINSLIESKSLFLLYLSRPDCNVCKVLKGKIDTLADSFRVDSYYLDLDKFPEAVGQFSVFTVPVVIVYFDGKEIIRKARHFSELQFRDELEKFLRLINE